MTGFEFFCLSLFLLGLMAVPILVIALLCRDWGREERMEESLRYDPDPVHGQARFTTPEEERRRQEGRRV